MPIFDLFSKRQRRLHGELPDVYQYDSVPRELRVQIAHIIRDSFGHQDRYDNEAGTAYRTVHDILCREYGRFALAGDASFRGVKAEPDVIEFMLQSDDVEQVLDVVEICFRMVKTKRNDWHYHNYAKPKLTFDEAVSELNSRFREHGVGYQFESDEIIRIDSQVVHDSAVKPALHLLMECSR